MLVSRLLSRGEFVFEGLGGDCLAVVYLLLGYKTSERMQQLK